jgi:valyl-tRNA synthetase
VEGVEIYLPVSGMIDIEKEVARLRQELERIQQYIQAQTGKLGNKEFVKNAPKEIVEIEQQKLADSQDKAGKIEQQLTSLQ